MIGSFDVARDLLLCMTLEGDPEEFGFKFVSSGAYRRTYIYNESFDVVYKVDKDLYGGKRMSGYNYSEWIQTVQTAGIFPLTLSDGRTVRAAEAQLFDFGRACIIAQEYVPYSGHENPIDDHRDVIRVQEWFGIGDFHNDNYRIDYGDNVVITDLGFNDSGMDREDYIICAECGNGHYRKRKFPEAEEAAINWLDVAKKNRQHVRF